MCTSDRGTFTRFPIAHDEKFGTDSDITGKLPFYSRAIFEVANRGKRVPIGLISLQKQQRGCKHQYSYETFWEIKPRPRRTQLSLLQDLYGHSKSIKRQLSTSRLCTTFCTSECKVLGGGPLELIDIKGRNAGDCGELNRLNASSADYIPDQDGRPIKSLFCNRKQKRIAGMKTWVG